MRLDRVQPARSGGVFVRVKFVSDVIPLKSVRRNRKRATTHKRVEYQIAGLCVLIYNPRKKVKRFLVLVYLFFAGNARKSPYIVVTRRAGIEGGAPLFA